jgi:PAS domain-containing protein
MRQTSSGPFGRRSILLTTTLLVLFAVAALAYLAFLGKSRRIELYDDLNLSLGDVRVSITKLEYLLDMFVVARRFESAVVDVIKDDVAYIDGRVADMAGNPAYAPLLKGRAELSDGVSSIAGDWQATKAELKRLDGVLSQDEAMLIHVSVDTNTIMIVENSEKLMGVVAEERRLVFEEEKTLALLSLLGFMAVITVSAVVFRRYVIEPVEGAARTARAVSSGYTSARFGGSGLLNGLASELNGMTVALVSSADVKRMEGAALADDVTRLTRRMESFNSFMETAGSTLSQGDIFAAAARAVAVACGAGAVYVYEGSVARLKTFDGFDGDLVRDAAVLPRSVLEALSGSVRLARVDELAGMEAGGVAAPFSASGFRHLAFQPIHRNGELIGVLCAAFRDHDSAVCEGALPYLAALASAIGALNGRLELYVSERSSRVFLERLMDQFPYGVSVFERSGRCVMMNAALKGFLGAEPGFSFTDGYNVLDDDVLAGLGVTASLIRTYEGYPAEFIVNYDPALSRRYRFAGAPRRVMVRSFPLYDAGGEISSMALVYDGVAGPYAGGLEREA